MGTSRNTREEISKKRELTRMRYGARRELAKASGRLDVALVEEVGEEDRVNDQPQKKN